MSYFFQKEGKKKIITVYNSKRPISISNANNNLAGAVIQANVLSGDAIPNAGPTFPIQEKDAVMAVNKSILQTNASKNWKTKPVKM